jgi:hypothetical protein
MTDFSDCGPTAAFEKPSKLRRMMLMRHDKCDNSVNKYDSDSDVKAYDSSDDDSLHSLCSDSDPDDVDQREVGELKLLLTDGKI